MLTVDVWEAAGGYGRRRTQAGALPRIRLYGLLLYAASRHANTLASLTGHRLTRRGLTAHRLIQCMVYTVWHRLIECMVGGARGRHPRPLRRRYYF